MLCRVQHAQSFLSKFTIPKQTAMLNKPSEPQWLRLCQHLSAVFLRTTIQLGKIYPSLESSSNINQSLLNLEEKFSDNLSCTGMKRKHKVNAVSGSILHTLDNEDIFRKNPMQFQCNFPSSYFIQLYLLPCRWTLPRKRHSKSLKNKLIHSALTAEGKIISPPAVILLKMPFMQINIKKISVRPWARSSTYMIILCRRCR